MSGLQTMPSTAVFLSREETLNVDDVLTDESNAFQACVAATGTAIHAVYAVMWCPSVCLVFLLILNTSQKIRWAQFSFRYDDRLSNKRWIQLRWLARVGAEARRMACCVDGTRCQCKMNWNALLQRIKEHDNNLLRCENFSLPVTAANWWRFVKLNTEK